MKAAVADEFRQPLVVEDRPIPSSGRGQVTVQMEAFGDLDLLGGDLSTVCGQLEELATMWRRQCHARNSWFDMPHGFPQGLRGAADGLAGALRALVEAGPDQRPGLALSAVAQLDTLEAGLDAAVAGANRGMTGDACGSTELRPVAICITMSRVRIRQRSLIAHLVKGQGMLPAWAA